MLKSWLKIWNKPYPAMAEKKDNLLLSIAIGLFVFFFLMIFKPFKITEEGHDSVLMIAGFGLVTTSIMLINFYLLNKVVDIYIPAENWKLKHTFYSSLWNISTIAIGNYFYMVFTSDLENNFAELFAVLYYTLSIGVFPVLIILIYSEHKMLISNQKKAAKTTSIIENRSLKSLTKAPAKGVIELRADISSDDFILDSKALLFIKADGNYSTFVMENNREKKEIIKRISLKSVEEQIKNHSELIRCHRSYIIHIDRVKKVSGNARNINLHFDDSSLLVPVSRAKEKEVLASINHLE